MTRPPERAGGAVAPTTDAIEPMCERRLTLPSYMRTVERMNDGMRKAGARCARRQRVRRPTNAVPDLTPVLAAPHPAAPELRRTDVTPHPSPHPVPAPAADVVAKFPPVRSALDQAIEAASLAHGASGVVDLLVAALTDRQVTSDDEIDRHLDALKSACRQTRRYRDAIPVFKRIVVLNPARRHEVAAELAVVHLHLGDGAAGRALLEAAVAGQRRLPAHRRSVAFCVVAEIAAIVLRLPELAHDVALMGMTAGQARPSTRSQAPTGVDSVKPMPSPTHAEALPLITVG
jgi:hypothetical protein